jgi:hypothetical protein
LILFELTASDDEDSDKEDTPVVESCILVETLMLVLETTPVMFLENLKVTYHK